MPTGISGTAASPERAVSMRSPPGCEDWQRYEIVVRAVREEKRRAVSVGVPHAVPSAIALIKLAGGKSQTPELAFFIYHFDFSHFG
jgi:hypothetical protein